MSRAMAPGRWGVLTPLGGGRDGKFFGITPSFVDLKRPPGYSPMPTPTLWSSVVAALTLRHIWAGPYLIWLCITVLLATTLPMDLSPNGLASRGPLTTAWFAARLPAYASIVLGYHAFWHVTLSVKPPFILSPHPPTRRTYVPRPPLLPLPPSTPSLALVLLLLLPPPRHHHHHNTHTHTHTHKHTHTHTLTHTHLC
jgi:hypothetical protein